MTSTARFAAPALEPVRFELGMPQLCANGLSEPWLLKEAGHAHWRALARGHGRRPGEMTDLRGRRIYAAFTQVHLREARLDRVVEDETLQLEARWVPLGRAQAYSQQRWHTAAGTVALIEMLSVFVVRERDGDNHSVARAAMADGNATEADPALAPQASASHEAAREVRAGAWNERFGTPPTTPSLVFHPCPTTDFNGAGLLYFASFQAFADRALWAWGLMPAGTTVRERQMVFHGNVNVGDRIELRLQGLNRAGQGEWTWLRVVRGQDGLPVADVATRLG